MSASDWITFVIYITENLHYFIQLVLRCHISPHPLTVYSIYLIKLSGAAMLPGNLECHYFVTRFFLPISEKAGFAVGECMELRGSRQRLHADESWQHLHSG